ncbi:ABC transporter permease [Actinorugispora endophytica]|uniref:ABC-2 type transport system permease protein n=1 Tax=Actinorugispora endophytica TaxID=1605990 RepID=A0A4R6V509_9ACTN|nr:ABC transporter permease [Actinorugispora endophytica]TDQ55293.1 ABC-2 type transport system permease protein [Actinorugispora endophytica]
MNTTLFAVRLGLARGWTEFRHTLTSKADLGSYLLNSMVFLAVLLFMSGNDMENTALAGTGVSQATLSMPGTLAVLLVFGGVLSTAQLLATDREDGTLLRAKATPKGTHGYLVGKVVSVSLMSLMSMLVLLVPSVLLIDGLEFTPAGGLTLLWVVGLGLLATLPLGAIAGSLFPNPRAVVGVLVLVLMALIIVSGIFFPISMLPGWVSWVAQAFPVYWLGLGLRSSMLPDAALVEEVGGSWRHLETAGALGAWAALGLLVAPFVLRRMARRESGTSLEERRRKALQRVG